MVLLPQVRLESRENITLTQPGGPAVIAIIGTAQWGELDAVRTFESFSNFVDHYKDDAAGLTLVRGADLAYKNGAFTVKSVRIDDGSAAKAEEGFDGNTGGEADVLTFSGLYEGTYGNNVLVTVLTVGTGRTITATDGILTENYTNNNDADGYATNAAIGTAINGNSQLVSVAVKAGSETSNLVDAASAAALTGGLDGASPIASDFTTAFDDLLNLEDFDILIIPGEDDDSFHSTMVGKLDTRASTEKKFAIYLTGVTEDESIATQKARTASGERLSIVSPSITYTLRYNDQETTLDGTYLACAAAGVLAKNDVEVSLTRKVVNVEGLVVDSTTSQQYYNSSEMEELLNAGIMPISLIHGGLKVSRGITRESDQSSINFELNIVRIVDFISRQVFEKLDGFIGDPNLSRVRTLMGLEVDGILQQAVLDEVIVTFEPTEVTQAASPDTVNVSMTISPTFAINFINVTLAVSRL